MEAIILAGGFGTRLRPLTYTRAKSLLPIMNKPMISYLIDSLPSEVDKVILAVNYRKKQIEEFFEEYDTGKEIIVNDEPEPLGTGGAVKFAENHLTRDFFVLNSDIICSLDLSKMMRFHQKKQAAATISLWPVEKVSEFGVADVQDDGLITGFVEKPKPEDAPSNLINAGAYLLSPDILDYIEPGRLVSMEKEIFPQIITDTNRFYGYQFDGYWMDIGRIKSYLDVHTFLLNKEGLTNYHGKNVNINGFLEGTVTGDNVTIEKNATIKSCIILDHAHIKEYCKLEQCVIGEKSIINTNCSLKQTVVGDYETVEKHTNLVNKTIWTQPVPEGYPKKQIGNPIQS